MKHPIYSINPVSKQFVGYAGGSITIDLSVGMIPERVATGF